MVLIEDICESKMKLFELRWHNSQIDKLCWKQTVKSYSQHVFCGSGNKQDFAC